jgi:hypothetical protein
LAIDSVIKTVCTKMLFFKVELNTLRTGDADLRLYAYKQFKYPVPNVLSGQDKIMVYAKGCCVRAINFPVLPG